MPRIYGRNNILNVNRVHGQLWFTTNTYRIQNNTEIKIIRRFRGARNHLDTFVISIAWLEKHRQSPVFTQCRSMWLCEWQAPLCERKRSKPESVSLVGWLCHIDLSRCATSLECTIAVLFLLVMQANTNNRIWWVDATIVGFLTFPVKLNSTHSLNGVVRRIEMKFPVFEIAAEDINFCSFSILYFFLIPV